MILIQVQNTSRTSALAVSELIAAGKGHSSEHKAPPKPHKIQIQNFILAKVKFLLTTHLE